MINHVMNMLLLTAAIGLATKGAVISAGLPKWSYFVALAFLSASFYVANSFLVQHFIKKRAPEFANAEETVPGFQNWELTAGLGVVPKWVSWIGLASIASLLAFLLPLIAPFAQR